MCRLRFCRRPLSGLPHRRRYLPPDPQVVLVSATLPHEVLEMTHKFMTDPVRVLVKRDELTLEVRHTKFKTPSLRIHPLYPTTQVQARRGIGAGCSLA